MEKVQAVSRGTFGSKKGQNMSVSEHFWKWRCRKSARRQIGVGGTLFGLLKKNGCHAGELAKLIFHTDAKMLFWLMGDCPAIRAEQVSLFGGVT